MKRNYINAAHGSIMQYVTHNITDDLRSKASMLIWYPSGTWLLMPWGPERCPNPALVYGLLRTSLIMPSVLLGGYWLMDVNWLLMSWCSCNKDSGHDSCRKVSNRCYTESLEFYVNPVATVALVSMTPEQLWPQGWPMAKIYVMNLPINRWNCEDWDSTV